MNFKCPSYFIVDHLICQDRQLVDLKNVVDWLSLEIREGDPLQWLA